MSRKSNVYEELMQWLETHNSKMPRSAIQRDGKSLEKEDMSPEEREETTLGSKWLDTKEYKAFKRCRGIPIEELPLRYRRYKEQIAVLRSHEQARQEEKKANMYKQIIEWLETYNGIMPRISRLEEGTYLNAKDMSEEQRYEKDLASRWYNSSAYEDFKKCKGISLDELPEEYEPYKEYIATLRRYEQMRKERLLKGRMRKSVADQAQNNANTRNELTEILVQLEDNELQTS